MSKAKDEKPKPRRKSSGASLRSSGNSTPRQSYLARFSQPTYDVLASASAASPFSMNTIIDNAVLHYVKSGELQRDIEQQSAAQQEAIRKLSGG